MTNKVTKIGIQTDKRIKQIAQKEMNGKCFWNTGAVSDHPARYEKTTAADNCARNHVKMERI